MENLYYKLTVWQRGKTTNNKCFRIQSNLPFPSPRGTEIFISGTGPKDRHGGFFVYVKGYEHRDAYSEAENRNMLCEFYMILGIEFNDELYHPTTGEDPSARNAKSIWAGLLENGWEEVSY